MSYRIILTCILPFVYCFALGQQDKVYLTNGSVIYGAIMSYDAEGLSLDVGGSLWEVDKDQLAGVKSSDRSLSTSIFWLDSIKVRKQFFHNLSVGFSVFPESGGGENYGAVFSYDAFYRVNQWIQPGFGIGFQRYNGFDAAPLFISFRTDFVAVGSTPYLYGAVGLSKIWQNNRSNLTFERVENTGSAIKAGLGYRWRFDTISLALNAGWSRQEMKGNYSVYSYLENGNTVTTHRVVNVTEFKVGIIF